MKRHILWLFLVMIAAAGCGEKGGIETGKASAPIPENVVFLGEAEDDVIIQRQLTERTDTGLLKIRTQFTSRDDDGAWVDIQVAFTDAQGFELYKTNWAPLHIRYGVATQHEITSLRSDVVGYEFRVRGQED